MIRKTLIALAAVATLGAGALAPTSASAFHGFHGFRGHHFNFGHHYRPWGFYGVRYLGADCYWTRRLTRWGTIRLVKVCSY